MVLRILLSQIMLLLLAVLKIELSAAHFLKSQADWTPLLID